MEGKIEERELAVHLTHEELLAKAKDLAKDQQDLSRLKDQAKSAAANFKDKITAIEADINIVSRAISNGYEYRPVKCRWEYDWKAGYKTLVRLDTLEAVRPDEIQESERQSKLPGTVSYTIEKGKTVICDGKYAGDEVFSTVCKTCDWPDCPQKEAA